MAKETHELTFDFEEIERKAFIGHCQMINEDYKWAQYGLKNPDDRDPTSTVGIRDDKYWADLYGPKNHHLDKK